MKKLGAEWWSSVLGWGLSELSKNDHRIKIRIRIGNWDTMHISLKMFNKVYHILIF